MNNTNYVVPWYHGTTTIIFTFALVSRIFLTDKEFPVKFSIMVWIVACRESLPDEN